MTNGAGAGTSGGKSGTSGRGFDWVPLALVAAVAGFITILNATSGLMEAASRGASIDMRVPWVYEVSSTIMVVALTPLVGWSMQRWPPGEGKWPTFVTAHLIASTLFSAAHIGGMVLLRKLAFAVDNSAYTFADHDGLMRPIIYEWRKDLVTYAAIAGLYFVWGYWRAQQAGRAMTAAPQPAPGGDARIEIRDGARVVLLEPADIAWLEAAGNYVEVHAGPATHLVRGTLAAFEGRLAGRGFVRVHRSRLINRARVREFKPTPSGHLEITLDDGQIIAGSRRFRTALDSAS